MASRGIEPLDTSGGTLAPAAEVHSPLLGRWDAVAPQRPPPADLPMGDVGEAPAAGTPAPASPEAADAAAGPQQRSAAARERGNQLFKKRQYNEVGSCGGCSCCCCCRCVPTALHHCMPAAPPPGEPSASPPPSAPPFPLPHTQQALPHYERASELDPSCPLAFLNQAAALVQLSRYDEAAGRATTVRGAAASS